MKLRFPLIVLITAAPCISIAIDAAAQGYGLGMHSCAEFARAYAANSTLTEDAYLTWAQGFLSGVNLSFVSNTGKYHYINDNDMVSYKIRVRSYCDMHPLAQYAEAVWELWKSLPLTTAK